MQNPLNRKNIFSTQSKIALIVLIGILVIINLISINHFGRLDLTAGKQYSLSSATKNILKGLKDPLYIKVYFSETLPPDLATISRYVKDMLSEYHSYNSKINVEFIDPLKDASIENEVKSLGIPALEMQILEKDQFKVQKGYLGIALNYADKKEIIPVVQKIDNLEYDLTSSIKKLTSDELKKIGFLSGHEEHGILDMPYATADEKAKSNYTEFKKALDKNYRVTLIDTTTTPEISGIDTLIVAGPKKALTDKELFAIDQFIIKGGKVIFLLDEVIIGDSLQATVNQTGLEDLLKNYGLQVNQDLVIDSSNENVAFSSGYMQFLLPYAYWPKLIRPNFLADQPIMAKLQSISFPWVSSISPIPQNDIEFKTLATTTSNGATFNQPFNLDPQQDFKPTSQSKVSMIVEAKGKFKSFFASKDLPQDLPPNTEIVAQSSSESQIIALADSDFISDEYLQRFPANLDFALNAVDYLTMGPELITIRAKNLTDRPLKQISNTLKTWLKIINIIIIPLLIIIIGLTRFYLRKRKN
jgi:gliding-associated putative ABC transporter substrate-binding component GldG